MVLVAVKVTPLLAAVATTAATAAVGMMSVVVAVVVVATVAVTVKTALMVEVRVGVTMVMEKKATAEISRAPLSLMKVPQSSSSSSSSSSSRRHYGL